MNIDEFVLQALGVAPPCITNIKWPKIRIKTQCTLSNASVGRKIAVSRRADTRTLM